MKSIKDILVYIPFMVILIILSSCIKDDNSDCEDEVVSSSPTRINMFNIPMCYTDEDDEDEIIERIDFFIFDPDGYFIDRIIEYPEEFNSDFFVDFSLEPGNYKIVAWANLMDCYYITPKNPIPGQTTIDDMLVHLDTGGNDSIDTSPHILYFSDLNDLTVTSDGFDSFDMELNHNVHRFNILIEELDIESDSISIIISDSHGSFNFDNTHAAANNNINYITPCTWDDNSRLQASFMTMQLNYDHETYLIIYDHISDNIIFKANLIELVNKLKEQGVEVELESDCAIDVVIQFNTEMKVNVIINGWKVSEDDQQIYV